MRTPASVFTMALALGAVIVAPVSSARAQGAREEGPIEIEKCRTIDKPGSYKLVNNLVAGTNNCLVITADFVTVDLAGFSISGTAVSGPAGQNSGIVTPLGSPIQQTGIAVRNGSISGFALAVALNNADGSIVEGLQVFGGDGSSNIAGISAAGIVRNNTVTGNFGTGIGATGTVTGNYASSRSVAISVGPGSTVIGNTAAPGADTGLAVNCPSNVTNNTSTGHAFNLVLNGTDCNNTNNVAP